ncbi:MAG TPA: acyl-CoA dehydrogenase family protein [Phenylobacterium sp.]|uniref:acyl-CoA dehydrogenase family protein n=1 Tax=Phenylobacterium sp. TaxID=1871053 RepID=UPI002B49559D|nr:acyl-CoA dehydrogenase family protein [Phenylobacterium sp.]HKR87442.1 acyl-CoA dehydrogenase family protein [Phenylobacterium sp.]
MILDKVGDDAAFRAALRAWLGTVLQAPEARPTPGDSRSFYESQKWWMAERHKVGLGTPHWPSAYGGADLGLRDQIIIAEEVARARAPTLGLFTVSLNHLPHTLLKWGTEAQRATYLPGVTRDGVMWCQGFSEPGAGSDLAALRTRAVRDGDVYVVNGQKIWSSYSMYAEYCILLTRTDPDAAKHGGITFLILDMNTPGVEVRPLRQANGMAKFAEIFLTDVRIPVENRVGDENNGWAVAQTTLASERGVLSFERNERLRYHMEDFHAEALRRDAPWLRDDELRREFMRLFMEMQGCRRLMRRLLRQTEAGSPAASSTVPYVKLINTELRKSAGEFMVRANGIDALDYVPGFDELSLDPMFTYMTALGGTIAGGSNEIMRNLIAERILGMPRG